VDDELCFTPAVDLAWMLRSRELSARELLGAFLRRIHRVNPQLNAIVSLAEPQALERAAAADEAAARGSVLGLLHGLPIAVKDLADTAGIRTTYGSPLFADHVPDADAPHVALLRAAGAVIVGKTNTPEFGAGSQTFNSVFGSTRNPYDLRMTCGGSSGGAAAAVAAGLLPFADGSDLAASVRNPASMCGVVGLRTTPGLVPAVHPEKDDVFDPQAVIGPIARSAADAALLLAGLRGRDQALPLARPGPDAETGPADLAHGLAGLRVAWSADLGGLPVEPEVTNTLDRARSAMADGGAVIADAEPDLSDADEIFHVLRGLTLAGPAGARGGRRAGSRLVPQIRRPRPAGAARERRRRGRTARFGAGHAGHVVVLTVTGCRHNDAPLHRGDAVLAGQHRGPAEGCGVLVLKRLADAERWVTRETFRSLRKVTYGGSPISLSLLRRCIDGLGCGLAQMYASAESGSVVTCLGPPEHFPGNPKLTSAGRACPGNEVKIVGDTGKSLPPGVIGTILVKTPTLFVEYWRRPDATRECLADGWLRMPDAGYLDQDGYLHVCDRIDDTIIVAGQNIYPAVHRGDIDAGGWVLLTGMTLVTMGRIGFWVTVMDTDEDTAERIRTPSVVYGPRPVMVTAITLGTVATVLSGIGLVLLFGPWGVLGALGGVGAQVYRISLLRRVTDDRSAISLLQNRSTIRRERLWDKAVYGGVIAVGIVHLLLAVT
jgi:Asp-tRNA(Asn)/Glu-tRNA(Gln) amidotransferase A subunit family amidase